MRKFSTAELGAFIGFTVAYFAVVLLFFFTIFVFNFSYLGVMILFWPALYELSVRFNLIKIKKT